MKYAFPPLANQNSKIIILGTMPGEKSLELQEYYGNKGNSFWKILFTLFDQPVPATYAEKKQLLKENDIALWDVLAYCERSGSLDSNIKNEKANDFESFYKKHPNIQHVFFSSKNASKFYDKYVGRKKVMKYTILPSPSGANASKSFMQKLEEWEVIMEALK